MDEVDDSRFRTATVAPKRVELPWDRYDDYGDALVVHCECGLEVPTDCHTKCDCGRCYEVARTCVVYQIVNE